MKIRREVKKYIKDYKFNSLFVKNLILLLALIIVPLSGAVILAYYSYNNMQKNEIEAYNKGIVNDTVSGIERVLKEARTQLIYIGFNSNVELYMYDTEEIRELNYKVKSISELIRLPVISKDYIDNIYVHSLKSDKVITLNGISAYENFTDRAVFEEFTLQSPEDKRGVLLTTGRSTGFDRLQISVFQDVKYGTLTAGTVVMNLNLPELVKEINLSREADVYITDGEKVILSNVMDEIGTPVDELEVSGKVRQNSTIISGQNCITARTLEGGELEVISQFDLHTYQNKLSTIRSFILTFLFVMIVITAILATLISIRIFSPIDTILSSIREYRSALVGEEDMLKGKNELTYILSTIHKTVSKKRDVEEELSERVRLLKKAQSVALQSQINPHFLNNTLDTINWMAIGLLGGKNQISDMTTALSKMLRMSLGNTDIIIPMRTEIEHCRCYLEIQSKRYEGKFEVLWKISDELYECKTIRIILQPIVENAIVHGLSVMEQTGTLEISIYQEDNYLMIKIADDGIGMSEEMVEEIRDHIEIRGDEEKKKQSIGIQNVNQRIKLTYGEKYGITIESGENKGSIFTICLPFMQ